MAFEPNFRDTALIVGRPDLLADTESTTFEPIWPENVVSKRECDALMSILYSTTVT